MPKKKLKGDGIDPNARFIVLDPNGDYSKCFDELGGGCRVFKVPLLTKGETTEPFKLPAWMWNSGEWAAVSQAAPIIQQPMLQTALRELRTGTGECRSDDWEGRSWIHLRTVLSFLCGIRLTGASEFKERNECGDFLKSAAVDF